MIVEIADNSVLSGVYANLMAQTQRVRTIAIQSQDHWDRRMREHETIIETLAAGDSERLGKWLMDRVSETGHLVQMAFDPAESEAD